MPGVEFYLLSNFSAELKTKMCFMLSSSPHAEPLEMTAIESAFILAEANFIHIEYYTAKD